MTTTQYQTLLSFYKRALADSIEVEKDLMNETKKVVLELDELKVKALETKDTKEYLVELNYLLDRLY